MNTLHVLRLLAALASFQTGLSFAAAPAQIVLPPMEPVKLTPLAALEGPPGRREISGLVASRQWPGVFWAHNDSGDETRIYPVGRDGKLKTSARSSDAPGVFIGGTVNSDWEDIAVDASGRVIIGDVGNNSNARRDLVLYYVAEPEPTVGYSGLLKSVFFRYPEQKTWPAAPDDFNYDCEGIFTRGDVVYVVTKRRSDSLTKLYRLDEAKAGVVNTLTPVGTFDVKGRATASDASPDGHRLVITTYDAIWMFEARTPGGDDWFEGAVWWLPFSGAPGAESVCFDGPETILIGAEEGNGHLYAVPVSSLKKVR